MWKNTKSWRFKVLSLILFIEIILSSFYIDASGIRHARSFNAPFINLDLESFNELYQSIIHDLSNLGFYNIINELKVYRHIVYENDIEELLKVKTKILEIVSSNESIALIPKTTFVKLAVILGCIPTSKGLILDPAYYAKFMTIYRRSRILMALRELKNIDIQLAKLVERYNHLVSTGEYDKALNLLMNNISSRVYHDIYVKNYRAFMLLLEALNTTNIPYVLLSLDRETSLKFLEYLLEEIKNIRKTHLHTKYYEELQDIEELLIEFVNSYMIYYSSYAREVLKNLKFKVISIVTYLPTDVYRHLLALMSIGLGKDNNLYINLGISRFIKVYVELTTISEIQLMSKIMSYKKENKTIPIFIDPYIMGLYNILSTITDESTIKILESIPMNKTTPLTLYSPHFTNQGKLRHIYLIFLAPLSILILYVAYTIVSTIPKRRTPTITKETTGTIMKAQKYEGIRAKIIEQFYTIMSRLSNIGYVRYKYETYKEFIEKTRGTKYYELLSKAYDIFEKAIYSNKKIELNDLKIMNDISIKLKRMIKS